MELISAFDFIFFTDNLTCANIFIVLFQLN